MGIFSFFQSREKVKQGYVDQVRALSAELVSDADELASYELNALDLEKKEDSLEAEEDRLVVLLASRIQQRRQSFGSRRAQFRQKHQTTLAQMTAAKAQWTNLYKNKFYYYTRYLGTVGSVEANDALRDFHLKATEFDALLQQVTDKAPQQESAIVNQEISEIYEEAKILQAIKGIQDNLISALQSSQKSVQGEVKKGTTRKRSRAAIAPSAPPTLKAAPKGKRTSPPN